MENIRRILSYKHYFTDFLNAQPTKIQDKILKVIGAIKTLQHIPPQYLKHIEGTKGLYEARIKLGSNIWRVFCFFDSDRLVILLTGFQKKTDKTPRSEIERAIRLMSEYYHEKKQEDGY